AMSTCAAGAATFRFTSVLMSAWDIVALAAEAAGAACVSSRVNVLAAGGVGDGAATGVGFTLSTLAGKLAVRVTGCGVGFAAASSGPGCAAVAAAGAGRTDGIAGRSGGNMIGATCVGVFGRSRSLRISPARV